MRKMNCRQLEEVEIIEDCEFDSGNGGNNQGDSNLCRVPWKEANHFCGFERPTKQ